jgi:Trk-type K+ transport system membrane component
MKKNVENKLSFIKRSTHKFEYIFILIILFTSFTLLMLSINYQYKRNDTAFYFKDPVLRYVAVIIIFSLFIFILLLCLSINKSMFKLKGNGKDFLINFDEIKEEKNVIHTDDNLYNSITNRLTKPFFEAITNEPQFDIELDVEKYSKSRFN